MITRNRKSRLCFALSASITCILLGIALLPVMTQAAPPVLPPRPTPVLPPRPTPQPAPVSTSQPMCRPSARGSIELRFQTTPERIWNTHWQELWTVVQWQDSLGNWRDVEGWQGTFDEFDHDEDRDVCEGKKVWWVAPPDFGKEPFRWVIYRGSRGKLLAQSGSFYLPNSASEGVKAEVWLVP